MGGWLLSTMVIVLVTQSYILFQADSSTSLQHISFNISVHLPSIREFHDFSTDFTNSVFAHKIGSFFDMWSPTGFGAVHLNARNAPIVVGVRLSL